MDIKISDEDLDDLMYKLAQHSCDFIAQSGLDDDFDYVNFDSQMFFETIDEEKLVDYFQKLLFILAEGYVKSTQWRH